MLSTGVRQKLQWTEVQRKQRCNQQQINKELERINKLPNPLLASQLPTDPFTAMANLMRDLNTHGPRYEGMAADQAFDVIGGFREASRAQLCSTLAVGTLNVAGLDDFKLGMALLLMLHSKIDVMVLTDTQHTDTSAAYFKKLVQSHLGGAAKIYASDTTPREHERRQRTNPKVQRKKRDSSLPRYQHAGSHMRKGPGGIIFIIGPRWGPSLLTGRSDDSGHGALAEIQLKTQTGKIHILGTYWPEIPDNKRIHPTASNLWSRVSFWLRDRHQHKVDPIQYLQDLAITWSHTAIRTGSEAVILAGDLNSRWLPSEHGGQRAIEGWCDMNLLINGPRLIADYLRTTFITRGHEQDSGNSPMCSKTIRKK